MSRVCHVLTDEGGWAQRIALGHLLRKGGRAQAPPVFAVAGPLPRWLDETRNGCELIRLPSNGAYLGTARLSMRMRTRPVSLVHAWGTEEASVAAAASRHHRVPLLVHLDASPNRRQVKKLRGIAKECGASFLCSCQIIRRRLVEGGVADDRCVVVRPGVDFGAITHWKQSPGKAGLGADPDDLVVVLGDADDVIAPAQPLQYYLSLPSEIRHLHVFHGIGHYPPAHVPERLAGVFKRFIEEHVTG